MPQNDYYLFLDESGDHGLTNIDPGFPVFVLCSILCKKDDFSAQIDTGFDQLKSDLWGTNNVHFHSRDIRKCEKEFQILFDLDIKRQFYERLNDCISSSDYTIIASGIKKKDYAKRYGVLNDVYSISLTFIIERTIFYLDDQDDVGDLYILAEARGKEEDKLLRDHMRKIYNRGTFYVNNQRLRERIKSFKFYKKTDNHNGLQLADLAAYPIARHIIDPTRANPAFNILESKFYTKNGRKYGLKIFP